MSKENIKAEAAATDEERQPVLDKKKTLKDVCLEGLDEKGKGKDSWLW
jgi:biotin synthase-related radical SAM superfamily protein